MTERLCTMMPGKEKFAAFIQSSNWISDGLNGEIHRLFKFKDFDQALEFINHMGKVAKQMDHHPDFNLFKYNRVKVVLTSHSIKEVSVADLSMAEKINSIYDKFVALNTCSDPPLVPSMDVA